MLYIAGIVAFISEFFDSGIGMGYGTALAPTLLLMRYSIHNVIPAILISQLVIDIVACIFHHSLHNVDFRVQSNDFKVALALGLISSLGVITSTIVVLRVPRWISSLYIGILVISMGLMILFTINKSMNLSWFKILGISFLAAFNKGMSGGGYGPLLMGGQILSGVCSKSAVGITAFAEAVTCLVGFIFYLMMGRQIDWLLAGWLIICAIIAVPVAAFTVNRMQSRTIRKLAGIMILLLGFCILFKIGSN